MRFKSPTTAFYLVPDEPTMSTMKIVSSPSRNMVTNQNDLACHGHGHHRHELRAVERVGRLALMLAILKYYLRTKRVMVASRS